MEIKTMELKKIKLFEEMSEETNCYVATVYINGKEAISVRNEGHGGCDTQYPIAPYDQSIIAAANDYCKKNHPATVFLHGSVTKDTMKQSDIMYADLETWCGDKIQENALKKAVAKLTKDKVSYIDATGAIYSIKNGNHPEAAIILHIKSKHKGVRIINELSPDERVKALIVPRDNQLELSYDEAVKVPAGDGV